MSLNKAGKRVIIEPILNALLPSVNSKAAKEWILVHGFSNGCTRRLWSLTTICRQQTGQPFPSQLEVYDLCPEVAGRWLRDCHIFTRVFPCDIFLRVIAKIIAGALTTLL